MIVSWSPYGKTSGTSRMYTMLRTFVRVNQHKLSRLMKWEGADPAWWCARGYAVCQPDARSAARSEGGIQFFGEQEGRDAHALIEWLTEQPWCTGKNGMAGNSWLAVCQWFTAAEQPPHLAAIAPWEGFSDIYRDIMMQGGIPDLGFMNNVSGKLQGSGRVENPTKALAAHPLVDDYWNTKAARVDRITIFAYVVASYSNTVHTFGTFRAWQRLTNSERWLRIHDRQKWPDFYQEENQQDLQRFSDHYLKEVDNGWEQTPRVRYSLLDLEGGDRINNPAPAFLPQGSTWCRFTSTTRVSPSPPSVPPRRRRPPTRPTLVAAASNIRCGSTRRRPSSSATPPHTLGRSRRPRENDESVRRERMRRYLVTLDMSASTDA